MKLAPSIIMKYRDYSDGKRSFFLWRTDTSVVAAYIMASVLLTPMTCAAQSYLQLF